MTFPATIDVVESMGSDVFAYFTLEGGAARRAPSSRNWQLIQGAAETGSDSDQVVARLDADTKIREGEKAELWVDTRAVHVFDVNSGENLTDRGASTAAAAVGS